MAKMNKSLEFFISGSELVCKINKSNDFVFFNTKQIELVSLEEKGKIEREEDRENKDRMYFRMQIPDFKEDGYWKPEIKFSYKVRKYENLEEQI